VNDAERTAWLETKGFKVIRFSNEEILYDTERTINNIKEYIK
jgi:very-short-patch-repair endonuclease